MVELPALSIWRMVDKASQPWVVTITYKDEFMSATCDTYDELNATATALVERARMFLTFYLDKA